MITEKQYLEAVKTCVAYQKQITDQVVGIIHSESLTKTPGQLFEISKGDFFKFFPKMSSRLANILLYNFADKRICEITDLDLRRTRGAGVGIRKEFAELINSAL